MTTHRIKLIALFSALTLCLGPATFARANHHEKGEKKPDATAASALSTDTSSTVSVNISAPSTVSPETKETHEANASQAADAALKTNARGNTDAHALSSSTTSFSSQSSTSTSASDAGVTLVTGNKSEHRTLGDYKGQKILGSNQEELGKVNDFLVDAKSGEITGVVVSSGGAMGIGDRLRVMKPSDLKASDGGNFTASVDKAAFAAMAVVGEKDLVSSQSAAAGQVIRASKINGKDVEVAGNEVGEIEKIVINLEAGRAMALIKADNDFAGSSGDFLVPFSKLDFSATTGAKISTTLTRADFASAAGNSAGVTAPGADATLATTSDNVVTPTGRTTDPISTGAIIDSSVTADTSRTAGVATANANENKTSSAGNAEGVSASTRSTETTVASANVDAQPTANALGRVAAGTSPSSDDPTLISSDALGRNRSASVSSATPADRSETEPSTQFAASGPASAAAPASTEILPGRSATSTVATADSNPDLAVPATTPGTGVSAADTTTVASTDRPAPATESTATSSTAASTPGVSLNLEPTLTPTGRTSAGQNPYAGADSSLITASTAIRTALDGDDMLRSAGVRVIPGNGKVVLRGTVSSDETKQKIEAAAKKAASDAQIENEIKVEQK